MLALVGEPIWGEQEERMAKAKTLFEAWYSVQDTGITINAAKDVTKGGLVSAVYEICEKSDVKYKFEKDIPYSMTRNLDNFIVSVAEKDYENIKKVCDGLGCRIETVGRVI